MDGDAGGVDSSAHRGRGRDRHCSPFRAKSVAHGFGNEIAHLMPVRPTRAAAWAGVLLAAAGGGWAPAQVAAAPAVPRGRDTVRQRIVLGHSAAGRAIVARRLGDPNNPRRLLVVGSIHGDETAGIAVARRLFHRAAPADLDVWIVPTLDPDGMAVGRRQNSRDVDLNRNFPFRWQRLADPGATQYSGERALSEPESRIAWRLINRIHPRVTVWFHQSLGVVDLSGGHAEIEHRYARLVGLPVRRLPRYPGSATGWQNHAFPNSTAFVVELPPGPLSGSRAGRFATAALTLMAATGPTSPVGPPPADEGKPSST